MIFTILPVGKWKASPRQRGHSSPRSLELRSKTLQDPRESVGGAVINCWFESSRVNFFKWIGRLFNQAELGNQAKDSRHSEATILNEVACSWLLAIREKANGEKDSKVRDGYRTRDNATNNAMIVWGINPSPIHPFLSNVAGSNPVHVKEHGKAAVELGSKEDRAGFHPHLRRIGAKTYHGLFTVLALLLCAWTSLQASDYTYTDPNGYSVSVPNHLGSYSDDSGITIYSVSDGTVIQSGDTTAHVHDGETGMQSND